MADETDNQRIVVNADKSKQVDEGSTEAAFVLTGDDAAAWLKEHKGKKADADDDEEKASTKASNKAVKQADNK